MFGRVPMEGDGGGLLAQRRILPAPWRAAWTKPRVPEGWVDPLDRDDVTPSSDFRQQCTELRLKRASRIGAGEPGLRPPKPPASVLQCAVSAGLETQIQRIPPTIDVSEPASGPTW
jgi:hypothetical protein